MNDTPARRQLSAAAQHRQSVLSQLQILRSEVEEWEKRKERANEELAYWQGIVRLEDEAKN